MLIRTAELRDLPELLEIYNHEVLYSTATMDLNPQTMEQRRRWFDAHNVDNHPLIVAEVDGEVAGYASLSPFREKDAYRSSVELSIYVGEKFRQQGIGNALMGAILDLARQDPITRNVVSVITSNNEASKRLHAKHGFLHGGTIPKVGKKFGKYLGIDQYFLLV